MLVQQSSIISTNCKNLDVGFHYTNVRVIALPEKILPKPVDMPVALLFYEGEGRHKLGIVCRVCRLVLQG